MHKIYPTDLLELLQERPELFGQVAYDTETSGLYADAGARVSTVSIAWILEEGQHEDWSEVLGGYGQHQWEDGIWTLRLEQCEGARTGDLEGGGWIQKHWVVSMAWPFDQGALGTGKPEDRTSEVLEHGQGGLLGLLEGWTPDAPTADSGNLGRDQWDALAEWLVAVAGVVDGGLTAHNAKFDILMMGAGVRKWPDCGIDLLELVGWDTMLGNDLWVNWIMAKATGSRPTSALKPTARWLWGETEGDEQDVIKRYLQKNKLPKGRWDLMPWAIIAKYADQDARLTARLRRWQEHEAVRVAKAAKRKTGLEAGWRAGAGTAGMRRRMDVMRMLTRVERRGLPFHVEQARAASTELEGRIAEVEAVLGETLAGKVTLDMAKHYWFGRGDRAGETRDERGRPVDVRGLGHTPYAVTDNGAPVVDVATLSKMQRDGLPMVDEWIRYKRLDDARARWYDGWSNRAGADQRLRTSFRQVGTASGRFSVEGVQLQAIPADYRVEGTLAGIPSPRDLIGAGVPDGMELWEMDLAQAELRVAAYMAGCQKMLDAIDRGADLHGETATALFGVHPGDPDWGEKRQVAKRSNFSLIFGVGWATFQETLWKEAGIDMPEPEVRDLVYAWNQLYPEFRAAIRSHEARVLNRYRKYGVGWMVDGNPGAMGERRWFPAWDVRVYNKSRERWEETAHKAFNQRVQPALAQYGMDLWLGAEDRLRARYGDGEAGLCLMVHDSMVLLLPEGDGEEVCEELRSWGRELWSRRFPGLPGDLDASRWSEHA